MQFEKLKQVVIAAIEDIKGEKIVQLDVRGKTSFTDLMIIASGTSSRHVKSIADHVAEKAKQAGAMPLGMEGEAEAEWVLVDLGDIVVHVMQPQVREFYGLEKLWGVEEKTGKRIASQ
ncbi:MAG: ribosome-associated protein [Pseudomonadota bacterium]|nr:ribosome-associated protein [Pseudomonadota bacterium]